MLNGKTYNEGNFYLISKVITLKIIFFYGYNLKNSSLLLDIIGIKPIMYYITNKSIGIWKLYLVLLVTKKKQLTAGELINCFLHYGTRQS